jgi:hypothetical protein
MGEQKHSNKKYIIWLPGLDSKSFVQSLDDCMHALDLSLKDWPIRVSPMLVVAVNHKIWHAMSAIADQKFRNVYDQHGS